MPQAYFVLRPSLKHAKVTLDQCGVLTMAKGIFEGQGEVKWTFGCQREKEVVVHRTTRLPAMLVVAESTKSL